MIDDFMEDDSAKDIDVEKIAREVGKASNMMLLKAREEVKVGKKLIDVAESLEDYAKGLGFGLAFPVNISINEYAAHYTPTYGDETVFKGSDVVKVDVGAMRKGVLGDCAITIDLSGKNANLVEASREALDNALSMMKAGVKLGDIGKEISRTIEAKGLKPIENLGGHGVGVYDLHSDPFIPNFDNGDEETLKEGAIVALETFATDGKGYVVEGDFREVFGYAGDAAVRSPYARALLNVIKENYEKVPFAARWLAGAVESKFALYAGINDLLRYGVIEPYNALVEAGKGLVSQAEVEVIVQKDGCEVLTK